MNRLWNGMMVSAILPALLVVDLKDWPECLHYTLPVARVRLQCISEAAHIAWEERKKDFFP